MEHRSRRARVPWAAPVAVALLATAAFAPAAAADALMRGQGTQKKPWRFDGGELTFGGARVGDWVTGPCYERWAMSNTPPRNGDTAAITSGITIVLQGRHLQPVGKVQSPSCSPVRLTSPGRHVLNILRGAQNEERVNGAWFIKKDETHTSTVTLFVRPRTTKLTPSSNQCQVTVTHVAGSLRTYVPNAGIGNAEPAGTGRVITAGRAIQTGHDSTAIVTFPDGGILALRPQSGFVLDPHLCANSRGRTLATRRVKVTGDGTLDSEGTEGIEAAVGVGTRATVFGTRGTRFSWRTAPDRRTVVLRVSQGAVAHPPRGRARLLVRAGRCVTIPAVGTPKRPYRCGPLWPAPVFPSEWPVVGPPAPDPVPEVPEEEELPAPEA